MPRKYRKLIIYIMVATMFLGTVFAGVGGLL
ncbi:stressosome-associated protein Prli42 [Bacillus shivajii]|nr:stressosome-associated protein Prli42 [Bacillus shivajii]UCZ54635.1 stressosome-associated protein Prli42 [Bacillus shivajii]